MATKSEPNPVNFKNMIDQEIAPGDDVVIVTTGYGHSVSTKKGTYLGKHANGGVQCKVYEPRTRYLHKPTQTEVDYFWNDPRYQAIPYASWRGQGLRYGTPEYAAEQERYRKEQEEAQAKRQAISDEYEPFKVPHYRRTTLQLNRIFKLDTTMVEAAKL